jgi:hypothetical protein
MPRNRFYNRRSRHEHPCVDTTFGDCPPSAVGKPAGVPLRDRPGARRVSATLPGTAPDHLAVIRPPTAARLTARRRLRADRQPTCRAGARVGERAPQLFRLTAAPPGRTLWHLCAATGDARSAPMPSRGPVPAGARQCDRPFRARGAFHRARPRGRLRRARPERCFPLAGGTAAARVHRCSQTATRSFFASSSLALSGPRALVRLLQVDIATSTTEDRSNIPTTGGSGGDGCQARPWSFLLEPRTTAEDAQGQGPREPNLGAPQRDCSRSGLCPNPDRFGHLLSRAAASSLSGATRGEDGAATAAHDCRPRATKGPCDAGSPRREPTFTNPRGLSSPGHPRRGWGARRAADEPLRATWAAPFSPSRAPGEGRSRGIRWPGRSTSESSELLCLPTAAAPPATSAFE